MISRHGSRQRASGATRSNDRALVLRFHVSPTAILGEGAVIGLRVRKKEWICDGEGSWSVGASGEHDDIDCGLVLTAVGQRADPMAAVPFDPVKAVVPNHRGRVLAEDGNALPRTYVTGWIKRGPSGGIGLNKHCSAETVESLVEDFFADVDCRPTEYGVDDRARSVFAELLAVRRRHSASRR
jgi:ferredoxin/flavodoxin---NADP+ reductase